MQFNLISWLFTDPATAGANTLSGNPETFHFYLPWLIFCTLGVLVGFYYAVEGRKRFLKSNPPAKYMFDRFLGWLTIICVIGYPLIFSRAYLYQYFFAWRVWRYLWLASLVAWAILWLVYALRRYPAERQGYLYRQKQQQYIPKGNKNKTKAASSR